MIHSKPSYTGANGFYSSVDLLPDSIAQMTAWFQRVVPDRLAPLNYEEDIGLHCTVMYSKAFLQIDTPLAHKLVDTRKDEMIDATIKVFDYWPGHDDKGYFVAQLDSPYIKQRHEMWKTAGAIPTFDDYNPHVTLATGPSTVFWKEQLEMLNTAIKAAPLRLVLINEVIKDLN